MLKWAAVDILAWLAILGWIAASIYFVASKDAELFQRFGAVGVVLGVIYYATVPPPAVHPVGLIETQALRDKTLLVVSDGALIANSNVSLLALAIQGLLEAEEKTVPESIRFLAQPARERIAAGESLPRRSDHDEEIDRLASNQRAADVRAGKVERGRFLLQAGLVVIGTLQAGFGSMILEIS